MGGHGGGSVDLGRFRNVDDRQEAREFGEGNGEEDLFTGERSPFTVYPLDRDRVRARGGKEGLKYASTGARLVL